MPLIEVKMIEEVFTPEQKTQVIKRLTDSLVSVKGEYLRPYTVVVIDEVRSGDWGVGGQTVTTDAVRALAAK
jgi:4-oxalocrotonate tautomerase